MKKIEKYLAIFLFIFPFYLFSNAIKVYNSERAQVEASIAINPTNSKNLIGTVISMTETSKHIDVFYTFDNGNSWTVIENVSGEGGADPVVRFDQDGIAYLVYQIRNNKSIYIKRSTDGGKTWSNSFTAIHITENNYNVDKPWLAIDPVRNANGYFDLYVSYTKTNDVLPPEQGYSVRLLKSSDRGENFSEIYSRSGYFVGSTIAINNKSIDNFVLAYLELFHEVRNKGKLYFITFNKSNFGPSQENKIDVKIIGNFHDSDYFIKNGIRVDSYPRLSTNNLRGDYYLVWANGSADGFSDLRMIKGERQNDGSLNWTYKGVVIDELGFQFDPTISVSQDGVVSILYYSSENNSENTPIFTYLKSCTDGSCNFSNRQTLGYNNGFIMQQDSKFLGDYQGLVSWYDNAFGLFCQSKTIQGCEDRQIYFQTISTNSRTLPDQYVKVKVDQQDENGISFGRFKRWNQNQYTSYTPPLDFLFEINSKQIIEAQQNFKNGTYEKYNNFEQRTDIKNHGKFLINYDQNVIRAKFKSTSTAKLKAFCISGNVTTKAEFRDPWLLLEAPYYNDPPYGYRNMGMDSAEFREFSNELDLTHESAYKGVFLDQRYDIPNNPYYSVKAQAQQNLTAHGQDVTGYFLNWGGTDVDFQHADQPETPVVFHAANAEARAVYKGHLASSVARATGYNNGRRIAKSGSTLHLVYEDNGEIWYTYSTNNGQTWAKETRISAKKYTDSHGIEHSFIHPSIAAEADGAVYVAFECQLKQGSTTDTYILFRTKVSNWSSILTVSSGHYNSYGWWTDYQDHDDSYPTVTAGNSGVFVAYHSVTDDYHHYQSIRLRQCLYGGEWSVESKLSSATGLPVIGNLSGTYKIALVWPQNGRIKYRAAYTYYNDEKDGWDWHWASEYDLSNYCPGLFDEHSEPSIAIDASNHGYMAWLAVDQEMDEQNILYQKFNFGASPSSASSVYSLDFNEDYLIESPSISFESGTNYVTVFYQYHDNIYRKRLSGSSWYFHNYYAGKYPSISSNAATGAVWTKYTSAPYLLQTENLQSHLAKVTSSELTAYKRFYFPTQTDSSYLITDLTSFECNGRALHFYDGLNSDTLQADQPLTFTYHLEFNRAQAGKWLRFWFVSGDEKYLLDQVELTGEEKENTLDRSVTFDAGKAKEGYVQIDFPESQPFVINVVPEDNSGSGLAKVAVAPEANPFVPKTFRLNQNFPNPFNPTTQIVFDLPREAKVTLEVFDINGHKIATLAEGQKAAGRYHVVFDGKNLASGVYIYRLTTDKGFVQSKKMMLIR